MKKKPLESFDSGGFLVGVIGFIDVPKSKITLFCLENALFSLVFMLLRLLFPPIIPRVTSLKLVKIVIKTGLSNSSA